jgi:serine/threonine protein kinase
VTSADAFFSDDVPNEAASLHGKELVRAYWRARALREEMARKEEYWSTLCDALGTAYEDLERTTRELAEARAAHLSERVELRSQELLAFARDLVATRAVRLEPGMVLSGRTRVLEPIGQGGSGIVYHAYDEVLGGDLAVKVLRRPEDPDATVRFLEEAAASGLVAHPAIVRPLHLDVSEDGLPYILMDCVDGRSLHAQLITAGVLPVGAACRFGAVLADALAAAHDAGLIHRDVKPGNVMITAKAPGLRVLDFGISRAIHASANRAPRRLGALVGTPANMSPEQVRDPDAAGPAADVYGAGTTLFEAITGRPPFQAATPELVAREHLASPPPLIHELRADIPLALSQLVGATLEKRAEDRPTARELARHLDALGGKLGALPAMAEAARLLTPRGEETL